MIEDFTDVNRGEKELMKLWNNFAMEERYAAWLPALSSGV